VGALLCGVLVATAVSALPTPAGAVTAAFDATCVTQSGSIPISTTHRSISYEVHAPDSVAPGTTFDVPVVVGYAIPSTAQVGGAFVDVTGASTVLLDAAPGASQVSGTVTATALGGAGSVVEVRLARLAAFAVLGGSAVGEVCTPDHALVLARVAVGVPLVSIGDAAVIEGDAGTRLVELPVTLSRPASAPVTVGFTSADGTATAGSDYVAASGTVTVPTGAVSGIVRIRVRGDTAVEPKENFRVRLHDPVGAVVGRRVGTGRIIDDDPGTGPRLAIGDGAVVEGARGARSARFTVSLSAPATQRVTFHWSTLDGSAVAGSDYRSMSLDGTIDVGRISTTVPVPVLADSVSEPTEMFTVRLSDVSGATRGRTNGVGKILDDD
jgi:hypothetical protein